MGVNDQPDDPFANVSKAIADGGDVPAEGAPEAKPASARKPKGEWVFPVSDDAPDARTSHNRHGKPHVAYTWRKLSPKPAS